MYRLYLSDKKKKHVGIVFQRVKFRRLKQREVEGITDRNCITKLLNLHLSPNSQGLKSQSYFHPYDMSKLNTDNSSV